MSNLVFILIKNLSYLSISKFFNLFKLKTSFFLSRHRIVGFKNASPAFISVEPANFCQLHCPECPVGRRRFAKQDADILNNRMYKKLIEELKSVLIHVIFYFQGEPLLNKNLPELIKYAHDAGVYTSTSTNAQLLDDGLAESLVRSGLDRLIVSIDGTTQEVYEKYRVGGSLEKAEKAVQCVRLWKEKLKSATPLIELQFLVLGSNEHQMKDMKVLAKRLGADKLTFKTAQLYDFENGHELLPANEKYARYRLGEDGKYHIKSKLRNRCWRLWSGAVVTTKGDVLPCCFDKDAEFSFGNIGEKTFQACWHGEEASAFRQGILDNRKQFEMCRNCTNP